MRENVVEGVVSGWCVVFFSAALAIISVLFLNVMEFIMNYMYSL